MGDKLGRLFRDYIVHRVNKYNEDKWGYHIITIDEENQFKLINNNMGIYDSSYMNYVYDNCPFVLKRYIDDLNLL